MGIPCQSELDLELIQDSVAFPRGEEVAKHMFYGKMFRSVLGADQGDVRDMLTYPRATA